MMMLDATAMNAAPDNALREVAPDLAVFDGFEVPVAPEAPEPEAAAVVLAAALDAAVCIDSEGSRQTKKEKGKKKKA
jgi:hypothetical protein